MLTFGQHLGKADRKQGHRIATFEHLLTLREKSLVFCNQRSLNCFFLLQNLAVIGEEFSVLHAAIL